uniref:Uncharacterized protein n=1 Tax=Corethron hystrix TaxID=216773 RepID=A0A7S1FV75_9STRA|mmetsp:Transcript_34639/g.80075  ORF Transcript_34639/g.80075 Transcript_34639/m.80075 type:complete len:594 (+) Transcript_34639:288-2069(+)
MFFKAVPIGRIFLSNIFSIDLASFLIYFYICDVALAITHTKHVDKVSTNEKAREVADSWFDEQRRIGLMKQVGPGSSIFGKGFEEIHLQGLDPKRAFEQSEVARFPDRELSNAAKKLQIKLFAKKGAVRASSETFDSPSSNALVNFDYFDDDDTIRRNLKQYENKIKADISAVYDPWAQGYRMLGGFIDCDHSKDESGSGSRDSGEQDDTDDYDDYYDKPTKPCGRWMMWAAYYNPDYSGGGWEEYYEDDEDEDSGSDDDNQNDDWRYNNETGIDYSVFNPKLDCHQEGTNWVLIGVYRQEFYQFIEQISKHLWDIDSYEYITTVSGLAYMTDSNCFQIGQDEKGNALYAGPRPLPEGNFMIGVYTDIQCLSPTDKYNYDDFEHDDGNENRRSRQLEDGLWNVTQEQTLADLNEIMDSFKLCRLCLDYPTYQDGYFIGDTGTDDGSIINQCWKFHSHDSFSCNADCILLAHWQGNLVEFRYGKYLMGGPLEVDESIDPIDIFFSFSLLIFFAAGITSCATFTKRKRTVQKKEYKKKRSNKSSLEYQNIMETKLSILEEDGHIKASTLLQTLREPWLSIDRSKQGYSYWVDERE